MSRVFKRQTAWWIDFKDARYCEGCVLAKMAREWGE